MDDEDRLAQSLLELELVVDQGLVHKVAHVGRLVPSDRVVINVNLAQAVHHLQLVLGTYSIQKKVDGGGSAVVILGICSRPPSTDDKKKKKRKYFAPSKSSESWFLGMGKEWVTSRTPLTSKPINCPVTVVGTDSRQCLTILRTTC